VGQLPEHFIGGSILLSKGGSVQMSVEVTLEMFLRWFALSLFSYFQEALCSYLFLQKFLIEERKEGYKK
jgi:hypothetical protein